MKTWTMSAIGWAVVKDLASANGAKPAPRFVVCAVMGVVADWFVSPGAGPGAAAGSGSVLEPDARPK
jgi:hypothetical protein